MAEEDSVLSWADFVLQAQQLVDKSNELNDGWHWIETPGKLGDGESYLKKTERKLTEKDNSDSLCTWEYHILHSPSFCCPVLYFNVHDRDGQFLGLNNVVHHLNLPTGVSLGDYLSVVSQTEHPILRKPYCYLHPCRTGDLLRSLNKRSNNVLICWLSCVAPVVRLEMDLKYAATS